MHKLLVIMVSFALSGCLGMPERVTPVSGFQLEEYLGEWYEVARLDHSFEEGLSQVSANYTLKSDGGVRVINRGYSQEDDEWQQAEGKAYFVNESNEGYLKVSFFGPFYGSYVVFDLDKENYQYAFVSGPNNEYLWLLARTKTVDSALKDRFLTMSKERGFNTDEIIWVDQN
ncbi:lipocalin family protein [Vibrio sp. 10N.261.55.A7]|uniref:lipocalin family protein n=1 Tax=Vibrio sp. 10N.261.55.A7 TaxID=1880851 RepID=UPI000C832F14|nr:lipocalin family protein [Vibrio sp. 10N.261.55.A7]